MKAASPSQGISRGARVPLLGMNGRTAPAQHLLSGRQWTVLALFTGISIAATVVAPHALAVTALALATLVYITAGVFRAWLAWGAWRRATSPPSPPPLRVEELPRYTVLVPLYREANMLLPLVSHLSRLDYPHERLEILLLCEADDRDTIVAVEQAALPAYFRLVVCPDGTPRTKPRACNFGLEQATGELCVIYDAEDRPERGQLRLAAETFRSVPDDVVCLQAPLDYHNHNHNWLTRFFTVEYNFWFDLLLPGMVRLGFPVPLGGTSNHLRVAPLRLLGGWDPYNVTEDADLGLRLAEDGDRTQMIASVTYEEACCSPAALDPAADPVAEGLHADLGRPRAQGRAPPTRGLACGRLPASAHRRLRADQSPQPPALGTHHLLRRDTRRLGAGAISPVRSFIQPCCRSCSATSSSST